MVGGEHEGAEDPDTELLLEAADFFSTCSWALVVRAKLGDRQLETSLEVGTGEGWLSRRLVGGVPSSLTMNP